MLIQNKKPLIKYQYGFKDLMLIEILPSYAYQFHHVKKPHSINLCEIDTNMKNLRKFYAGVTKTCITFIPFRVVFE